MKTNQIITQLKQVATGIQKSAGNQESQLTKDAAEFNRITAELDTLCHNVPRQQFFSISLISIALLSLTGFAIMANHMNNPWQIWVAAVFFPVFISLSAIWKWSHLVQAINEHFIDGIKLITGTIAPRKLEIAMQMSIVKIFESTAEALEDRLKKLENEFDQLQMQIKDLQREEKEVMHMVQSDYSRFIRSAFGEGQLSLLSPLQWEKDTLIESSKQPCLKNDLWENCSAKVVTDAVMLKAEELAQSILKLKVLDCVHPDVVASEMYARWWINQVRVLPAHIPGKAVIASLSLPPDMPETNSRPANGEIPSVLVVAQIVPEAVPIKRNHGTTSSADGIEDANEE